MEEILNAYHLIYNMKYLKVKVNKIKDKKDDAVTHYTYDKVDIDLIEKSKMVDDYLYIECKNHAKEGTNTVKITKEQFENKLK